jgi:hypothetical protein
VEDGAGGEGRDRERRAGEEEKRSVMDGSLRVQVPEGVAGRRERSEECQIVMDRNVWSVETATLAAAAERPHRSLVRQSEQEVWHQREEEELASIDNISSESCWSRGRQ